MNIQEGDVFLWQNEGKYHKIRIKEVQGDNATFHCLDCHQERLIGQDSFIPLGILELDYNRIDEEGFHSHKRKLNI